MKKLVKKFILDYKKSKINKELIDEFHKAYYHAGVWQNTSWEGIEIQKLPSDLFVYQEILFKKKPDLIIETGTLYGGSALFMARILDIIGNGKIISVDIKKRNVPRHPRIKYCITSSINENLIKLLEEQCKGKNVMVILDSDHSKKHVLKELELYSDLVSKGQYLIVEDTNINGHPVSKESGPGPYEAVEEFLQSNNQFKIDKSAEKYLITFNPKGFLLKVED